MFEFFRALGIVFLGIVLAVSVGFVATPREATAPADTPPTPLVKEPQATTTPEMPPPETKPEPEENTESELELSVPIPASPPKKPSGVLEPGTPEYEKSLQDALDALAKLHTTATVPETGGSLNDRVRAAVVNVQCIAKAGGALNSISASGVIIDPKGVVLTNSHVAQFFLLKDYPAPNALGCILRTGSPAYPAYTVELLFMPPSWVRDNAQKIDDTEPTGNGEHDYALLRITGPAGPSVSLPATFPYLPVLYSPPNEGARVLITGYAAGFLGGAEIAKNLYASSSFVNIREFFTYGGNTPDLISLGGSVVAQSGASGGAVANEDGNLVGVVVTSTTADDTSARDLRALTTSYIAQDFQVERGIDLAEFLSRDLAQESLTFRTGTAPTLTQMLVNVLNQ